MATKRSKQSVAKCSIQRFFMKHNKDLRRLLNMTEVMPFLNKQLLTPNEMEELQSEHKTRYGRVDYLVRILGTKGREAPSLFIDCVKQANEHMGHDELATIMETFLHTHKQTSPATSSLYQEQAHQHYCQPTERRHK